MCTLVRETGNCLEFRPLAATIQSFLIFLEIIGLRSLKRCVFLYLGSGDEEMEIYDNDEEDYDGSDDGIEAEDDDDDEKEGSLSPADGAGSSAGTVVFRTLHSCPSIMSCLGVF